MENYKQWMEQKLTSEDMDKLPKVVKPLTEDQIKQEYHIYLDKMKSNDWWIADDYYEIELIQFARAIEKAHGIV
jgi:hypothetical protein